MKSSWRKERLRRKKKEKKTEAPQPRFNRLRGLISYAPPLGRAREVSTTLSNMVISDVSLTVAISRRGRY